MSDQYGALPIPVPAPTSAETEATGDPALDIWASFFKAVLNAHATAAWAKCFPRTSGSQAAPGAQIPPVLTTYTHEPHDDVIKPFNEAKLPALFLYREQGPGQKWDAIDWRISRDVITVLWVAPTGTQPAERIRAPFTHAIVKILDRAVELFRDPVWAYPGDPDPTAATLLAMPLALKLATETSTSPQTYAGAALDGAIGVGAISPPRAAQVLCEGPTNAYVDGSTVSFTGLDVVGQAQTRTVTISTALLPGPFATDHAFTQVTGVSVDAQASADGSISFGVGPFQGRGSMPLLFAQRGLKMASWNAQPIAIPMSDAGRPRYYESVLMRFEADEQLDEDLEKFDPNMGVELREVREDGSTIQEAVFEAP